MARKHILVAIAAIGTVIALQPSSQVTIVRADNVAHAMETVEVVPIVQEETKDPYSALYAVTVKGKKVADLSESRQKNVRIAWDAAQEEGIDAEWFVRLAFCESSLDDSATLRNTDKRKTLDRGLFQINDYWHTDVKDECAFDAECSAKWSAKRIKKGYAHEWMCSKKI